MRYKIMLDAGHGGYEPGAVYGERKEKDDNLAMTLAVGDVLSERGYDVIYTRTTDIYESPFEKATEANEAGADLFISIHRNAFPIPNTVSGVESLVYDKSGIKYEIAESIDGELAKIGFLDLGVKERPELTVLRRTTMPAVLVEVGFLDSDKDNALFDEKFDEIAVAIADGVTQVLDQNYEENDLPLYQVQVGLYRNKNYAERLLIELLQEGYPAYIDYDNQGYYIVKVGNYIEFQKAIDMEQELKQRGYETIIVTG